MKVKLSISVSEVLLEKARLRLESGEFRNTSHLIEFSINRYLNGR